MSEPEIVVAELPGGAGPGQDRCRTADGLVIVLDGASAFDKQANPDASDYVDRLADELLSAYVENPGSNLADGLAHAIDITAKALDIKPGRGPSSTVAVVRWGFEVVDTLVLGDSTVVVRSDSGRDILTDDSLAAIAPEVRHRYQRRLAAGGGFGAEHREDLARLQRRQAAQRNRVGGYWIAEADPRAAYRALCRSYRCDTVAWCAVVTDGAQRPIDYLHYDWAGLAKVNANGAFDLLVDLHHWETHVDPQGVQLGRSKSHDDKVFVVMRACNRDLKNAD